MDILWDTYTSVGTDLPTHWGQVLELPNAVGLIEVTSVSDNARHIGIAFLSALGPLLTQEIQIQRLKKSITALLEPEITSFLLLVPQADKLHVFVFGNGAAYMRRGKTFALLRNAVGITSGVVNPGDIVLLLSNAANLQYGKKVSHILSPELTSKEVAEALMIEFSDQGTKGAGEVGVLFSVRVPTVITPARPFVSSRRALVMPNLLEHVKKRPAVFVALGLGVFFVVSVVLGIRRQANDFEYKNMVDTYQEAERLFTEGVALQSVDQDKSRELLSLAHEKVQALTAKPLPKSKEARNLSELSQKISDNLAIVSKVISKELSLFYDAGFLRKGNQISLMTVNAGNLFFLDQSTGMLAVVSLTDKNADVLGGGDVFRGGKALAATDKHVYVLTDEGVRVVTPGENNSEMVISKDQIEGAADELVTFGGNLYLVDKADGKLWRYTASGGSFGKAQGFFAEDVRPDISQTTNTVIDGSVWMGSQIGKIFRYTQGRDDPYLIRNVDPLLGQHLSVAKEEDSETVYVLDSDNKRVVLLRLNGSYQAQYVWNQEITPTAIAVSEEQKRVYLLADQKVYVLTLQ